jgi:hypothetical protein
VHWQQLGLPLRASKVVFLQVGNLIELNSLLGMAYHMLHEGNTQDMTSPASPCLANKYLFPQTPCCATAALRALMAYNVVVQSHYCLMTRHSTVPLHRLHPHQV